MLTEAWAIIDIGLKIVEAGVLFLKIMLLERHLLFGFLNILKQESDGIGFFLLFINEDSP